MAMAAVDFEVNKSDDHEKNIGFYYAYFGIFWLFDFNHISEHNQTYPNIIQFHTPLRTVYCIRIVTNVKLSVPVHRTIRGITYV